jgi:GxxExxY protein
MDLNVVTREVIGGAIAVHRALGPGLLESAYDWCLMLDLQARGLSVERQLELPVTYRGVRIPCGYRLDLLVENAVIVELKAVTRLEPIHEAQLLSYLRLSDYPIGLLLNFNVKHLLNGLRRFVGRSYREPSVSSVPLSVPSVVPAGL